MRAGFLEPKLSRVMQYKEEENICGLIRALRAKNQEVGQAAADALAGIGSPVTGTLLEELGDRDIHFRLGIIGVLSKIGDTQAVGPLIGMLSDKNSEVRWQTAIALGKLGDPQATGPLVTALCDHDKYVRYGAAASLAKIGWEPAGDEEKARYYAAIQEWEAVKNIGSPAIAALEGVLDDRDPEIRLNAIRTLGEIGIPDAAPALFRALGDEDRKVRWQAVLASQKCKIPLLHLPRGLARRPRNRKNPYIAGFLNFMLPGLGYGYLGKWWGIMIFQIDVTATIWLFKINGEANSYGVLFPLYLILAIHAWYLAEKMPEDPP